MSLFTKTIKRTVRPYKGGRVVFVDGAPYALDYEVGQRLLGRSVEVRDAANLGRAVEVRVGKRWLVCNYDNT